MAQFGDLLAELRQDKKLTQKQLAKIIFIADEIGRNLYPLNSK